MRPLSFRSEPMAHRPRPSRLFVTWSTMTVAAPWRANQRGLPGVVGGNVWTFVWIEPKIPHRLGTPIDDGEGRVPAPFDGRLQGVPSELVKSTRRVDVRQVLGNSLDGCSKRPDPLDSRLGTVLVVQWIWSTHQSHEALVPSEDFAAVQAEMAAHAHRPTVRKAPARRRCYVLSGLVRCGLCGRRMPGNWNHDAHHYRCKFPAEYALANKLDHPKNVYIRESAIVPELDRWLAQLFDPEHLEETVAAMADVGASDESAEAAAEAAWRKLADCDDRLAKYRTALDSGADPVVVAGWISEVTGERLVAEAQLATVNSETVSEEDVRRLIEELGDMTLALAEATAQEKADIYSALGLSITYYPEKHLVIAVARPGGQQNVSEGGLELSLSPRRPVSPSALGAGQCTSLATLSPTRVPPWHLVARCALPHPLHETSTSPCLAVAVLAC